MKILIYNWRDIRHPQAGGAELYVHEVGKRLVQEGHEVVMYCGGYAGCISEDVIDGIHIHRRGGRFSLYIHAVIDYVLRLRRQGFHVVIESINGVPFFTPLYVGKPKIALIYHLVKKEIFFRELPPPLAIVGCLLEKLLPLVYHTTQIVTISTSSKSELVDWGVPERHIKIAFCGINGNFFNVKQEDDTPIICYIGRIKAYKRIDLLVRAFARINKELPESRLVIAGRGSYAELRKLRHELQLENVLLLGEVSETKKLDILRRTWVFVMPSMKEGWGLTVIEANACGTPVVAFDVPGVRDSLKHEKNGLLVPYGDVNALARAILALLHDSKYRAELGENAVEWAKNFSWDKTADGWWDIIQDVCKFDEAVLERH